MLKILPDPVSPQPLTAGPLVLEESQRSKRAAPKPPIVRYVGFRSTDAGREYTLQVCDLVEPRLFVLLIPHAAFTAHQARFQDAPDLCCRKLNRALLHDPDLQPGAGFVVSAEELLDYRQLRESPPITRVRRAPAR